VPWPPGNIGARSGLPKLSDYLMPSDKRNWITAGYGLDIFTVQHCFIPRCAFLPTAAAPMLASWFYQSLPLFSFIVHSLFHYRVGDDLR